jgi:ligand-binding sensor domain-containing protein/signal transduction histidine kinase
LFLNIKPQKIQVFLFIISYFYLTSFSLFSQSIKFKHLTVKDGLSNNIVKTVIQDKTGFIWFGTNDGLNRYDGYNFKIFRHDSNDSNSISDNGITALFEDKEGFIWVGTRVGTLNRYDPKTESFKKIKIKSLNDTYNSIKTICKDSKGNIWVGTHYGGLYELDAKYNIVNHWLANSSDSNSLSNNYVLSIIEDNFGRIVIGTYNGLNIYDPKNSFKGFKSFYHNATLSNTISGNIIWALSKSSIDSNIIWIGSNKGLTKFNLINSTFNKIKIDTIKNTQFGASCGYAIDEIVSGQKVIWVNSYGGLSKINFTSGKSIKFIHDKYNFESLINNQINKILKDRTGVLWIATEGGISYCTLKSTSFNSLSFDSNKNNFLFPLKNKNITALSKYNNKEIWIGTEEGLYLLNNIKTKPSLQKIKRLNGTSIWTINVVNKSEIWIGTYGSGLKYYNYIEDKVTNWPLKRAGFVGQSINFIKTLLKDSKGNIWIGYWGLGAARINLKTGKKNFWLNKKENSKSLSYNTVWTIKEDRMGRIWIGTLGGGLNLFENKGDGIFHHWFQDEKTKNGLSSNIIYSIYEAKRLKDDSNNETVLWLGTANGLNKFIIKNDTANIYNIKTIINSYTLEDGLSDNSINSIVEDAKGNLWLGSNTGISFFNVSKESFTSFSSDDGINGTTMNSESVLKLDNNIILFGSTEGLNIFDPEKIKLSSYNPNVVITDFKIFNKSVKIGSNFQFKESIQELKEIVLTYKQEVFSFEFAALDYNSSHSIKYAYQMEGFDKDWVKSGSRRQATYTNLDPGNYIFKIKSTNADGIWNKNEKTIAIIIKPPFWKTMWAYAIYSFVSILSLYSFGKYRSNKRKKREKDKLKTIVAKERLKQAELRAESAEYKTKIIESEKEIEKQQIRNRISADLHDEIGSNLSSIILLSSLVNNNLLLNKNEKKYITEIHSAAKISAEAIRDIVWFINPATDQIENLVTKMLKISNTMLVNIKYEIIKSNIESTERLHPNVKRNIFYIYKEILNNIVKHSHATFVKINISRENKIFCFSVEDNGIGFDLNTKKDGNGLKNLKYRASQINCNLQIFTKKKVGTKITLEYKIA